MYQFFIFILIIFGVIMLVMIYNIILAIDYFTIPTLQEQIVISMDNAFLSLLS